MATTEYHKIQSIYKRDMTDRRCPLIDGAYTLPEFAYLANNRWVWTEKIDGTNIRVMYRDGVITFGGRTDNASIPAPLVAHLQNVFLGNPISFGSRFSAGETATITLYGEGYGAKINGGEQYRPDQSFILFDAFVNGWWLRRDDVVEVAANLGIPVVPIVGAGTLPEMVEFVRNGFQSSLAYCAAEGVVARPEVELRCRNGERVITKAKTRDFWRG